MPNAGPNFCGTGANFNDGGTTAWSNPTNAQGDTTSTAATCNISSNGGTSQKLRCSNFGFSVPAGVTIQGVTVEIERSAVNNNRHFWNNIQLLIGGSETGNNNSDGSAISTTKQFTTFGSASDLWGLTPSVSDVNGSGFGVSIKISRSASQTTTTSIFRVRITVTYGSIFNDTVTLSATASFAVQRFPIIDKSLALAVSAAIANSTQLDAVGSLGLAVTTKFNRNAFKYYRTITIDHTKVPSDQTNFTILVSLTNNSFKSVANGGRAESAYDHGRPFSDQILSNPLSYELEKYDPTTGEVVMWIKIPSLSSSADTVIYLGYGSPGLTVDNSSTTAWDSDFAAVYHFGDGSTLGLSDSSGNGRTLTNSGVTATTGKIVGAAHLDGVSASMNRAAISSAKTNITISIWVKQNGSQASYLLRHYDSTDGSGYMIHPSGSTGGGDSGFVPTVLLENLALNILGSPPPTLSDGVWGHLVLKRDSTTWRMRFNGSDVGLSSTQDPLGSIDSFDIGAGGAVPFAGDIDELRFSTIYRSDDWDQSEYNNQSDPSSFSSLGAEQPSSNSFDESTTLQVTASIANSPELSITATISFASVAAISEICAVDINTAMAIATTIAFSNIPGLDISTALGIGATAGFSNTGSGKEFSDQLANAVSPVLTGAPFLAITKSLLLAATAGFNVSNIADLLGNINLAATSAIALDVQNVIQTILSLSAATDFVGRGGSDLVDGISLPASVSFSPVVANNINGIIALASSASLSSQQTADLQDLLNLNSNIVFNTNAANAINTLLTLVATGSFLPVVSNNIQTLLATLVTVAFSSDSEVTSGGTSYNESVNLSVASAFSPTASQILNLLLALNTTISFTTSVNTSMAAAIALATGVTFTPQVINIVDALINLLVSPGFSGSKDLVVDRSITFTASTNYQTTTIAILNVLCQLDVSILQSYQTIMNMTSVAALGVTSGFNTVDILLGLEIISKLVFYAQFRTRVFKITQQDRQMNFRALPGTTTITPIWGDRIG